MAEVDQLEVFKIGRMRIVFPPDMTEDELQFASMVLFSYIQTTKYKNNSGHIWKIAERLEEKKKNKEQVGVS